MNNKTKKANQGWWYRWVPYVKLQSLPSRIFIHQDIHFYTILNWSFFPLKFLTPSRTQHSALGTALPNLHQCSRGCDRVPIWCPPPHSRGRQRPVIRAVMAPIWIELFFQLIHMCYGDLDICIFIWASIFAYLLLY